MRAKTTGCPCGKAECEVRFEALNPCVYERAAASVLNASVFPVPLDTPRYLTDAQAEPFCCWAIETQAKGCRTYDACADPHNIAFRHMFCPSNSGIGPAYWWNQFVTERTQQERAIALLLMAEILRARIKKSNSSAPLSGATGGTR